MLSLVTSCRSGKFWTLLRLSPSKHGAISPLFTQSIKFKSDDAGQTKDGKDNPKAKFYPNTTAGIKERNIKPNQKIIDPLQTPYPPFPDGKNPKTGEAGGPTGPEPTRFGDWERKGRVSDF